MSAAPASLSAMRVMTPEETAVYVGVPVTGLVTWITELEDAMRARFA